MGYPVVLKLHSETITHKTDVNGVQLNLQNADDIRRACEAIRKGVTDKHGEGHFLGVTTVVAKLFNMVQPDVALFGEKDWQQLIVIRRLVADLDFPIKIVGVPTVRESDGLAMSSRNGYLSVEERAIAPILYATLTASAERLRAGEQDYERLTNDAKTQLAAAGFRPDYFEIRRAYDLQVPADGDTDLRILAAAWLGRARLIDNLAVA